jgi:hypothetical protein
MSNRRADGYSTVMSKHEFHKGDKVSWQSHGSTAEGKVEEKITSDKTAAKRKVRASEDDPQYRVRSDKSGNDAVHKPAALKKESRK